MQSRVNKMSKAKAVNKTETAKAHFQVVNLTDSIQLTQDETAFCKAVQDNMQNAEALKNKRLIKIARRTYANSVIRRNDELTETAILDISLAAFRDLSSLCTLQQVIKFIQSEFKTEVSRSRLTDHIVKNKYHKAHTTVSQHDILRFKSDMI
jgi:hypothetical protein